MCASVCKVCLRADRILNDQSGTEDTFMFQLTRGKKQGGFYGPGQEIAPITSTCVHLARPAHMVTQFQE